MCKVVIFFRVHRNFIWGWRFVSGYLGGILEKLKKWIFEILDFSEVTISDSKDYKKICNSSGTRKWGHHEHISVGDTPRNHLGVGHGTAAVYWPAIRYSYSASGGFGDDFYSKITKKFVKNQISDINHQISKNSL